MRVHLNTQYVIFSEAAVVYNSVIHTLLHKLISAGLRLQFNKILSYNNNTKKNRYFSIRRDASKLYIILEYYAN